MTEYSDILAARLGDTTTYDMILSSIPLTSITYNGSGDPDIITYDNGFTVTMAYTGSGKVDGVVYRNELNTIVEQWQFSYDGSDNMSSSTRII